MQLDLRVPLGLLFALLGGLLLLYGLTTGPETYTRSLGLNVNRDWGAVLLAFGLVMLALARRGRSRGG